MNRTLQELPLLVEREYDRPTKKGAAVFRRFISLLNRGTVRAVEKIDGRWRVNEWVKKGIVLGFRLGTLRQIGSANPFPYFDKHTFPLKSISRRDGIRIVPGGTSVRTGAYLAPGVIIMPPAYVNVGAYVSAGTMIDSHALVGSCAFIGERIHLSAAAQIGGVLEPIGALPVIVEEEVMIGGNCGIYEGTQIRRRAVIGSGVILNRSTPVYDLVNKTVITSAPDGALIIPENAVVVAGSRPLSAPFAKEHGLSVYTPLIVKYRDEKTDAKTALEESLR